MIEILLPVALLAGGLAAGALVLSALGGAPMLLALPADSYLPVHKFLVTRFDPFMPICLLTALVCDALLAAVGDDGATRAMAGAAVLLYASVVIVSVTKNVPINRWVAGLDPAALPDDFDSMEPRVRWRNWNLVRTILAVLGLTVNTALVGVLL
ncbi:DUF1772 domain-containing protein [Spirillospora sp. NPDC052242]